MAVRPNLAWSGRATPSSTLACRALALAAFPTRATVPRLSYNTAAVVLAATNSFVWNRRFTFRVRGPLRAGEVARFAVVAAGTAGLNDLVLLVLSAVFPALMGSGTASSERA